MWGRSYSIPTNDLIHVLCNTNPSLQEYMTIFCTKSSIYARADEKVLKINSKSDKFYCKDHCLTHYCKSSEITAHSIFSVSCNYTLLSRVSLSHNGLMTSQSKEYLHNSAISTRWYSTMSKVNTIWRCNNVVGMSPWVVYFTKSGKYLLQKLSWRPLNLQKWWISISRWVTEWSCVKWHYTGYLWESAFNLQNPSSVRKLNQRTAKDQIFIKASWTLSLEVNKVCISKKEKKVTVQLHTRNMPFSDTRNRPRHNLFWDEVPTAVNIKITYMEYDNV
jgi:hypothetical protein